MISGRSAIRCRLIAAGGASAAILLLAGCASRPAVGPAPTSASPAPASASPVPSAQVGPLPASVSPLTGPAGATPSSAGSPSLDSPPAIPVGRSSQTITVSGLDRTFHLYRPAVVDTPAPLVVMLHGGFGSGSQAEQSYGWDAQADAGHFLVAYPDGIDHAWNTDGGCCGKTAAQGVDDVAFIADMVGSIEHQLPIDPARVFATGISNGGIMAYTLACRTAVFAAIGPDSATMLASCANPTPLSVIAIHGTADTRIPYDGGPGQGTAHIDGPAVPAVSADWRAIDGCAAPTTSTAGVVTTATASCLDGRAVELITVAGAGHQWPGAVKPASSRLRGTDPPSTALNATEVIWAFFAAHPR